MPKIVELTAAVAELVRDGATVALEGLDHLVPYAAAHEIVRLRRRRLTLARSASDQLTDQLVGAGCVETLVFSRIAGPDGRPPARFLDALGNDWPAPLRIEEHTHPAMAARYAAGAARVPFAVLRDTGTDLPRHTPTVTTIRCPFTGSAVTAVVALVPDVTVVHAQRADRAGNVEIRGPVGMQKDSVFAARASIVTVEEIVDELDPAPGSVVIPGAAVTAVVLAPGGAAPSRVHGYYERDDAALRDWAEVSADRERFGAWLDDLVAAP
ncbi:CoA transferase subunit A [Pseudonocardia sp. N23]|uniref:CoA transferase subunit A n=1 Tax=Pseudonocardia sp. N23 TaxID=1987376 RepID=UPI000BFCEC5F|nr:CoA-transferase [Pseudonocardia sp. N23]GAY11131.1 3-oxoadipate CoA-transferase subunit A [Pseudonocardia sp. N23]